MNKKPARKHKAPVRFFFAMAMRNLARHTRRSIITAIAIGAGVAMFIALSSIMSGFAGDSNRNLQLYELSSAGIFARGYYETMDSYRLERLVEDANILLEELEDAGFQAAARTSFRGELIVHYDPFPEDGSIPMVFTGVDPVRDPQVFLLADNMLQGRFLEGDEELIMGRWLAERLGAETGYTVNVSTRTRDGYRQLLDMEIVGIYETPNPIVDRNMVFIPLATADEYLEMRGAVTAVHVKLPTMFAGPEDTEAIRTITTRVNGDQLEVLSFAEMNREMDEMMGMADAYTGLFSFLLAIIAIVGVSNTMLMSVLERQKEIGMLRSLGFRTSDIRDMFAFEAAGIGIIGAVFGLILGTLLQLFLVNVGLDYGFLLDEIDLGYRMSSILYGEWNIPLMFIAAGTAIVIAGLVSWLPTRKILKKNITECMRQ
ncbi:ABC transporter permease [Spirochaeta dissipatitropha]